MDYIMRVIFVGSHHKHNQCFESKDNDHKTDIFEKLKEMVNYLSVEDKELIEKLSLEEFTLRLENLDHNSEKVRFGRKLLSMDQCSGDDCQSDEELAAEDTGADIESEDNDYDVVKKL